MCSLSHFLESLIDHTLENSSNNKTHFCEINKTKLGELVQQMAEGKYHFRLADITAIDKLNSQENDKNRFRVFYHFENLDSFERIILIIQIKEDEQLDSIKLYFAFAEVLEDEMFDLFGIKFRNENNKRTLTNHTFIDHPLRKDFRAKVKMSSDGTNVSTIGKTKIKLPYPIFENGIDIYFDLEEGIIRNTNIAQGLKHIGVEKISEKKHCLKDLSIIKNYNSLGGYNNLMGHLKSLEEFAQIEIPKKAQAIRMIFSEFTRISDHLHFISLWAFEAGSEIVHNDCIEGRRFISNVFELYSGDRNTDVLKFGGVVKNKELGWHLHLLSTIKKIKIILKNLKRFLDDSNHWHERNSMGFLCASHALQNGLTGPNLRASGINFDLRKRFPYYFYNEIDFNIPLGSEGTNFDRYLVRFLEIEQSMTIIIQLLDGIPTGEYSNDIELEEMVLKTGEHYSAIEASSGQLGHFISSDGSFFLERLHIISPNLGYASVYKKLTDGIDYEDAGLVYRSLNINASEIER